MTRVCFANKSKAAYRKEQNSNYLKHWAQDKSSLFWVHCCQDAAQKHNKQRTQQALISSPLRCSRSRRSLTRSRLWSSGSSLDCCTCSSSTAEEQEEYLHTSSNTVKQHAQHSYLNRFSKKNILHGPDLTCFIFPGIAQVWHSCHGNGCPTLRF